MASLYVNLLSFNNIKNEVFIPNHMLEWKKQISTKSKKNGLTPLAFITQKINDKLLILHNNLTTTTTKPVVFAYFNYNIVDKLDTTLSTIYLININNKLHNINTHTELHYNSHIPCKDKIIIIKEYELTTPCISITYHNNYISVPGDVIAICINNNSYYLNNINIDDYIKNVQYEQQPKLTNSNSIISSNQSKNTSRHTSTSSNTKNKLLIKNKDLQLLQPNIPNTLKSITNSKLPLCNIINEDEDNDASDLSDGSYVSTDDEHLQCDEPDDQIDLDDDDDDDDDGDDNGEDDDDDDDDDEDYGDDDDDNGIDDNNKKYTNSKLEQNKIRDNKQTTQTVENIKVSETDDDSDVSFEDEDEDDDNDEEVDDIEDDEEDEEDITIDDEEDITIDDVDDDVDEIIGNGRTNTTSTSTNNISNVNQTSKKNKQNKIHNKNIKLNTNLDLSIIFNILKLEDKDNLTPETNLYDKRILCLKILKMIDLPLHTIRLIEQGIYNYAITKCNNKLCIPLWDNFEFVEIYISKTKNIYSNLNTMCYVKNTSLLNKIKEKIIPPEELAFIDTYKLCPEIWTEIIEEKAKIAKVLKDTLKESATDMFKCPRCHKRKTIYCEVQTRSSDEPMTKFITCLECGCKWKQY